MSRLPTLTPRKVVKILKKNGFRLDHSTGGHLIFYHPVSKRRVTVPNHPGDLPKGTLLSILDQAGISRDEI